MRLPGFGSRIGVRIRQHQARVLEVFDKRGGALLAADVSPRTIDGDWDREEVVTC